MLTDAKEIAIIAGARQKNVRDPLRPREHFHRILADFFAGVELTGEYIDLGAGQFDFGEIVRERGGRCVGIDNDPCVIELGRHKGFESILLDLKNLPQANLSRRFDGVFNKFTLNAFWHWQDDTRHRRLVAAVAALAKPSGWAWIAPWNGVLQKVELSGDEIARVLELQRALFWEHGFHHVELALEQSKYYGINGNVANNLVFLKNLVWQRGGR